MTSPPQRAVGAPPRRDRAAWLLLAWAAAALAFALWRTPYDDEWISLGLALEREPQRFWAALAGDVHPPWIALLDRATMALAPWRGLINLTRVAAASGALWIAANLARRHLGLPRAYVLLAALHPVVFMYSGAARWYPLLFLAHALRALAIWGRDPGGRRSGALFAVGALIGLGSGYVEPPFLLHDLGWLYARTAGQPRARRNAIGIALLSAVLFAALRLGSPTFAAHAAMMPDLLHPDFRGPVTWLLLGIAGEAALPFPFMLLGVAVAVAGAVGARAALRHAGSRPYALFLASNALVWACVAPLGIWHPRYSIEVWLALSCMIGVALRHPSRWRPVAWLATAHLLVALLLTAAGRGFYKADLNRLDRDACAAVRDAGGGDLIVAPYPGLAELVTRTCAPATDVVTLGTIRLHADEAAQLSELRARLEPARRVLLLTVNTRSSFTLGETRARAQLRTRCTQTATTPFAQAPHYALKRLWKHDAKRYRFERETWQCGGAR